MLKRTRARNIISIALGLALFSFLGCAQPVNTDQPVDETTGQSEPIPTTAQYMGTSEICAGCHYNIYSEFISSGHPFALSPVSNGQIRSSIDPAPLGFTQWQNPSAANASYINSLPYGLAWSDISYVLGGVTWKMNFVDQNGRVIVTGDGSAAPGQPTEFDLPDASTNYPSYRWVNYDMATHSTRKDFNCGRCHTTAYSPDGGTGAMPGISGSWAAEGVQCEACHGPANIHVATHGDPSKIQVDRTGAICSTCHQTGGKACSDGSTGSSPADTSAHGSLSCIGCHDPHIGAGNGASAACATCHSDKSSALSASSHNSIFCSNCHDTHSPAKTTNVTCKQCHNAEYSGITTSLHNAITCASCHNGHTPSTPVSSTLCSNCHSSEYTQISSTPHQNATCGTCHNAHVPSTPVDAQKCSTCHSTEYTQLTTAQHNSLNCASCHSGHDPAKAVTSSDCAKCHNSQYTQITSSSHPAKNCASCHNGHSPKPTNIYATCTQCHGQPHGNGWLSSEHPKLTCTTCHVPHNVSQELYTCTSCHGVNGG